MFAENPIKYALRSTVEVAPTDGLDGAAGTVKIVAVLDHFGLPDYIDVDAWNDGVDEEEALSQNWYSFRYVDEKSHADWGVCTLPEWALDEMVASAAKRK